MNMNIFAFAGAALIPMVIGFIWYNPKVFGNAWMAASSLTEEKLKGANMPLLFGLSYVFSFFLALGLYSIVVHQAGVFSVLVDEPGFNDAGSEMNAYYTNFMSKYGMNFRTFRHGALHGTLTAILIALPILATNAMFERKSVKYVAINVGYWVVTIALMGGVICQFA